MSKNLTTGEVKETILEVLQEQPEGKFMTAYELREEVNANVQMISRCLRVLARERKVYKARLGKDKLDSRGKRIYIFRLWAEEDEDRWQEKMNARREMA